MTLPVNTIICGPAETELKKLPTESVNCSISSPPFWALRDYGTAKWEGGNLNCSHEVGRFRYKASDKQKSNTGSAGHQAHNICPHCGAKRIDLQLGLESTFELYIEHLCDIYDEVWRVLRPDGTCFVNLGDTYGTHNAGGKGYVHNFKNKNIGQSWNKPKQSIPEKSLCLIPERFAIEMVNRGWILRNVLVWHKPNPMPSSAKDRFTVDFEYVFFFVKNNDILWYFRPDGKVSDTPPAYKNGIEGLDWEWGMRKGKRVKTSLWQGFKYWFEPQYEPSVDPESYTGRRPRNAGTMAKHDLKNYQFAGSIQKDGSLRSGQTYFGRNKRCVWTIPTEPFAEAHFATFPRKLVEPMIKAGCPEFVCKKCGKAREKIWDTNYIPDGNRPAPEIQQSETKADPSDDKCGARPQALKHGRANAQHYFKGYTDCGCNAEWRSGVVLDPFRRLGDYLARSLPVAA